MDEWICEYLEMGNWLGMKMDERVEDKWGMHGGWVDRVGG